MRSPCSGLLLIIGGCLFLLIELASATSIPPQAPAAQGEQVQKGKTSRAYASYLDVAAVECLNVGPKAYFAASDGQEITGAVAAPRRDQVGRQTTGKRSAASSMLPSFVWSGYCNAVRIARAQTCDLTGRSGTKGVRQSR